MFVGPAPGAYVTPHLRFFRCNEPHTHVALLLGGGLLNRPEENTAYLDRSVVAAAEHFQRSNAGERADFVKYRRSEVQKEALDHVEGIGS